MELAERAARAAGEVLLSYYGRPPEGVDSKSSETDLVSDADREAERVIRELLAATVVVLALIALTIWFFFFARNPLLRV